MAGNSKISWTDATWNPITGCSPISTGCANCYAARIAKRLAGRCGYPADNPFRVTLRKDKLLEPLGWKKPRRVFVCSMGDLFHERVMQAWIDDIFDTMSKCPQHTFLVLTKRPDQMLVQLDNLRRRWKSEVLGPREDWPAWPLPNVWLGVTAENQEQSDNRIPTLLQIPAAKRFISCEPLLGPIELGLLGTAPKNISERYTLICELLHWVICGGETGPKARPMHPDWGRSLRDQCISAEVPFHFKSWGKTLPIEQWDITQGPDGSGRTLDGVVWDQFPEVK